MRIAAVGHELATIAHAAVSVVAAAEGYCMSGGQWMAEKWPSQ